MGLDITTITASGDSFSASDTTLFTMPALVPINSSLVIPGFRGKPEVTTITFEPAVAL